MKKISLLYVLLFVATATFFVSTKLSNAQISNTTDATKGTNMNTSAPYLEVVSPVGNTTYLFGNRIYITWNAKNINADYYYVLLENKALKNIGFVVSDNISPSTTTTNFEFKRNIMNTILANSGGLTEEQLQGGYYVRVIGIKRGVPYNSAVINGTSALFSIVSSNTVVAQPSLTSDPNSGLVISNASAKLGSPVYANNVAVVQPYQMTLTVTNNGKEAVYIRNKSDNRDAILTPSITSATSSNSIFSTSPNTLAGDGVNSFTIPVGASRTFTYAGAIRNTGIERQFTISMTGIVYGKAGVWPDGYVLNVNSPELRVSTVLGNSWDNTGTGTTTNPYLEIVSPVGNRTYLFGSRIYIAWNVRNADANYYYALLENTAIKDYGFVVADNIPLSTTTTSFIFNKNVLNTMLSSRFGLTEAQLQNGYYVRIIGVKKDFPNSNAVINATSGVFSISNSSNLVVSNTSAKLGSPVIVNNITVAQPYEMTLTITNYSNDAVYIRNKGDGGDVVFNTTPYTATSTPPIIIASPATISGDGINYFVIPVGASRTFSYYGSLKNSGSISMVSHEMVGIVSGRSNVWPEGNVITVSQGSLRLSTTFGTGKSETLPVISSINPSSGTTGTIVVLKGKNLAGFEGDLDAWIKDSKGQIAYLAPYGKSVYPKTDQITVAIPDKACKTNNSYSGLPCKEYLSIVPGNYKIFTNPWGNLSNEVYFTVTNDPTPNPTPTNTSVIPSSNNSMRVISPNGGEVLKKGSFVNIYYNKKPNDGSYRTDMYLVANDSQSVYTIQGKAGGTGIYDPSLGDSVVMYGWTVGEGSIINGTPTSNIPTGYYKLKVCLTGTSVCDLSDRVFAITETPISTYSSTPTPAYSSTPSYTPTPVYSSTPSPTATPTYSSTPTPVYSSTPSPTPTPVYSSTPSPTPTPTYSSTPTPTYSSTPTPTTNPSPTSSSSPRPSSSPTAFMIDQNSLNASIWTIVKDLFSI